jgi:hypothetical protein
MKNALQLERIYRIWSSHREDQIAVRIQFSVVEDGPARVFILGSRDEWV